MRIEFLNKVDLYVAEDVINSSLVPEWVKETLKKNCPVSKHHVGWCFNISGTSVTFQDFLEYNLELYFYIF